MEGIRQNSFTKVYNILRRSRIFISLTIKAKYCKLLMSFVVVVWLVYEVFDPKMSLTEKRF